MRGDEFKAAVATLLQIRGGAEPPMRSRERVRTPIDAFLLAKLETKGLGFSPDAERQILIRCVYFDLIGLPPEPAAVAAFLKDERPNACELLIDELLKSSHYGERWGRHWLDAAGYVDGKLDNDLGAIYPNNGIWRYRDYVIRAVNEDMPFDRFLSLLLSGGGFKAGHIHGATDEFGYKSVEQRVSVSDLHATLLHQLGLDHTLPNFTHNGRPERLTDPDVTGARVVKEVLA